MPPSDTLGTPPGRPDDLVLQEPQGAIAQLFLLHHGVGTEPGTMARLGLRLAGAFPRSLVVAVAAPRPGDRGQGRQWYSARGLSEPARVRRVAGVLDEFTAANQAWQAWSGVPGEATALVGFSQGAVLSLEAARALPGLAGRVLAFGGRFATLPTMPLGDTVIHLFHGEADSVVPCHHSAEAHERLRALGSDVTLDLRPGLGHGLDEDLIATAISRLKTYVPHRHWVAARAEGRSH